ncbi:formyltransferase [Nibricoccus sp. IMCC34717]|uniref:formyltransferase n=1 Tax=Nibricoccus sp. IMCC34717 TaxID=3034021 RepID=UPI00384BA227
MSRPRIVVFAYSEVGYECLRLLIERGDNVVALVTHEDNPNEKIWFKTPAMAAREAGIPVHTPAGVNSPEWVERIASWQPDLILSFYYRHMISTRVLSLARLGAFNMHGSLLPKFRGRAPINWAVVKGAAETGMTLHRMVKSADAGAIVDQEGVAIGERDTAEQLFRKVLPLARQVLARQIDALLEGRAPEREQDHSAATYFGARTPADGELHWNLPTRDLFNLIRAVTDPFPGAFTFAEDRKLMVWWAEPRPTPVRHQPGTILTLDPFLVATGDGALELTRHSWAAETGALQVGQLLGKSLS